MDIIQRVREDVRGNRGRLDEVIAATGIARGTLKHIVYDRAPPDVRVSTVNRLREFYARDEA